MGRRVPGVRIRVQHRSLKSEKTVQRKKNCSQAASEILKQFVPTVESGKRMFILSRICRKI